jgi:hypothetical protein
MGYLTENVQIVIGKLLFTSYVLLGMQIILSGMH